MREQSKHVSSMSVIACLFLILAGCGSNLKSKYDKIKLGMTVTEVETVMDRKADKESRSNIGGDTAMEWRDGSLYVEVIIEDEKVMVKSLADNDHKVLDQEPANWMPSIP